MNMFNKMLLVAILGFAVSDANAMRRGAVTKLDAARAKAAAERAAAEAKEAQEARWEELENGPQAQAEMALRAREEREEKAARERAGRDAKRAGIAREVSIADQEEEAKQAEAARLAELRARAAALEAERNQQVIPYERSAEEEMAATDRWIEENKDVVENGGRGRRQVRATGFGGVALRRSTPLPFYKKVGRAVYNWFAGCSRRRVACATGAVLTAYVTAHNTDNFLMYPAGVATLGLATGAVLK